MPQEEIDVSLVAEKLLVSAGRDDEAKPLKAQRQELVERATGKALEELTELERSIQKDIQSIATELLKMGDFLKYAKKNEALPGFRPKTNNSVADIAKFLKYEPVNIEGLEMPYRGPGYELFKSGRKTVFLLTSGEMYVQINNTPPAESV